MPKRKTHEQFLEDIKDRPIEVLGRYTTSRAKILAKCKVCGHEWATLPSSILPHGWGCPECARKARTKTHEQFVEDIKDRPFEVLERYAGDKTKIPFRCKVCGHEWSAKPSNVLQGSGCLECGISKSALLLRGFPEETITPELVSAQMALINLKRSVKETEQ